MRPTSACPGCLGAAVTSSTRETVDAGTRNLLTRGGVYTVARASQLGAGVIVLPVLTRVLGPTEFGRVATVLVVTQLLQLLGGVGLPAAVTRRYFEEDGLRAARHLLNATVLSTACAVLLAVATHQLWTTIFDDPDLSSTAVLAALAALPLSILNAAQALLRAMDRVRPFVTSSLAGSVGAQCVALGVAAAGDGSADQYLTGLIAGYTIAAATAVRSSGPRLGLPGRAELGAALRFGGPTILHSMSMYILSAGDRVVIERIEGVGRVGQYQVAYLVGSLGILLLNALNNAWSPLIYGAPPRDRWRLLRATSGMVHLLAALVGAGIAISGPLIARLLVEDDLLFDDLAPVVAFIAAASVPYASFAAYGQVLFQERRTVWLACLSPITAFINVGASIVLVVQFGLAGAAAASLLSYLILGAGARTIASHIVELPARSRLEVLAVLVVTTACPAGAVAGTEGIWIAVRVVASALIAGAFAYVSITKLRSATVPANTSDANARC